MLTKDRVLERLNLSPRSLELLVEDRIILELEGGLYPELQFTETGIDGSFAAFLGLFKSLGLTGDEIWSWINAELDSIDGSSPVSLLETAEGVEKLRFLASAHWSIQALTDPGLERTDWLRAPRDNSDSDGIGDYTPKRRGGQHGA